LSHISRIELQIKSLEDLKAACNELGFQFCEGQETYRWYENTRGIDLDALSPEIQQMSRCDHAIRVPRCKFDIGIVKQDDHYELRWDDYYTGGLVKKVGKDAGLLKQAYTLHKIKREARAKGYRVVQKKIDQGVRLILSA